MSNVVKFLEELSQVAFSDQGPTSGYQNAIEALDTEPAIREALLKGDTTTLSALLGGRATMTFVLVPAENEEPKEDEEQSEPGEEEAPSSLSLQTRAA